MSTQHSDNITGDVTGQAADAEGPSTLSNNQASMDNVTEFFNLGPGQHAGEHGGQHDQDPDQDDRMEDSEHQDEVKSEPTHLKSNIFAGMYITWSGKFNYPREELRRKIEEHGGHCLDNVSKKVTHVITTPDLNKTSRIEQALKYDIPLVDEQYIHDCVQAGQRLDLSKYLITVSPMDHQQLTEQQLQQHSDALQAHHHLQLQMQDPQQYAQLAHQQLAQHQLQQYDPATMAAAAASAASIENMNQEIMQQQQAQHLRNALQQMIHAHAQQAQMASNDVSDMAYDNNIGVETKQPDFDMSESSKFAIKMYVKGSRSTIFTEQFPDIFYTLTWKHKYDIRIISNKKIFKSDNNKIIEALTMSLVLAKTNELPIYDEDKDANKRRRKRQKVAQPTKRKQKKPTDTDTITISSLHKASEHEILIRFGINSTYCSKRFNYSAFRLFINYAPQDLPDDYHFTIYSAEFKTFVKKNANIAKYLNNPKPLNPTTVIITKETTIKTRSPYAQVLSQVGNSSFSSPSPKKNQRKRKRNTEYDESYDDSQDMAEDGQQQADWNNMGDGNLMNIIYPLLPMFSQQNNPMAAQQMQQYHPQFQQQQQQQQQQQPQQKFYPNVIPEKGIVWFGDPIGMNINSDMFYMAFCKDGTLYRINDFVYLAPEESSEGDSQVAVPSDPQQPGAEQTMHEDSQNLAHTENQSQITGEQLPETKQEENQDQSQQEHAEPEQDHHQQQNQGQQGEGGMIQSEPQTQTSEQTTETGLTSSNVTKEEMEDDSDFDVEITGPSAPESYWICKIINLVQTKNEGMKLIGQWFYRWCDVQGFGCNVESFSKPKSKKQYNLQKDKEVFVSFDLNYNSLNTVRGKCFVKYIDQDSLRKHVKPWLVKPHHYFFQSGFNRLRGEIFDLPDQMLKIMKETTNEDDENQIQQFQQQILQQQQQQQLAAIQLANQAQQMPMGMTQEEVAAMAGQDWRFQQPQEKIGDDEQQQQLHHHHHHEDKHV